MNIQPDIQFLSDVKTISKSPVKTCMQCGECSVVCSLASENRPFPRKEMMWAAWGLKNKLIGNPDVWLCHQCGDCSTYCPRGVKPADVMASIRQMSYMHYAKPRFLGVLLSKLKYLPVAFLIPVIVILTILYLAGTLAIPEGPVNYSAFFPHAWLNSSFTVITLISFSFLFSFFLRFCRDMKTFIPANSEKKGLLQSIWEAKMEIISHRNFKSCSTQKSKTISHFLVFYGFILLLFVTAYAIVATLINKYPLPFLNPFKVVGNVAALMLLVGLGMMMIRRLFNKATAGQSNYFDWIFLISLFALTLSGVVVELARFQNWQLAYHIYFFHLLLVWYLIIYIPYTKFGHFVYRFVSIIFCKHYNR